jgi:hypothetical protein
MDNRIENNTPNENGGIVHASTDTLEGRVIVLDEDDGYAD